MAEVIGAFMEYEIGMVGLGVMGQNLVMNMADHGFTVAGYDRDVAKVDSLSALSPASQVLGTKSVTEFVSSLHRPRKVMLLVPAGPPVDAVIETLRPFLEKGDLIIDAGNSYYKDTDIRAETLQQSGISFFGMGVSGGEEGARLGPSLMPGGPKEDYERLRPLFEAIAAKVDTSPCVAYLGPNSAGHFVKMVHNGIEYGLLQVIAETYDLMKRGLGFDVDQLRDTFLSWNIGELEGYLLGITGKIFGTVDPKTGKRLIDVIQDVAKQNGTGMWTSQCAMELRVPTPTITLAVGMRNMSIIEEQRKAASILLHRPIHRFGGDTPLLLEQLRAALYTATIITYAEGMAVLAAASEKLAYHFNLETIASIWREGCIIRSTFLEEIRRAYTENANLQNLLLDPKIGKIILANEEALRSIVCASARVGIPAPGFMTALSYLDAYRSASLPANLIQAQRDYFGAHTYERIDAKGTFHTNWEQGYPC
jgi:6-phosphogluconate dehydrogenase